MTGWRKVWQAAWDRGITTPEAFREYFGVAIDALAWQDALCLVSQPAWLQPWIAKAGIHGVAVYVPEAVREYGHIRGIEQSIDETDQYYIERLRAERTMTLHEQMSP